MTNEEEFVSSAGQCFKFLADTPINVVRPRFFTHKSVVGSLFMKALSVTVVVYLRVKAPNGTIFAFDYVLIACSLACFLLKKLTSFLADRTNGRAYASVTSLCRMQFVTYVLWLNGAS